MGFHISFVFEILLLSFLITTVTMESKCAKKVREAEKKFERVRKRISCDDKLGLSHGQKILKKCWFMLDWGVSERCLRQQKVCRAPRRRSNLDSECNLPAPICDDDTVTKFRTFDGSCNNLQNPMWGMANRTYNRLLKNAYHNGKGSPRKETFCETGKLPNARVVSNFVHDADENPLFDLIRVALIPIYGQLIAHDGALTPMNTDKDGKPLDCCDKKNKKSPECFPIRIQRKDPDFGNRKCMSFARSEARLDCEGVRQQFNMQTAYLDLSPIYGVSVEENSNLRTEHGGKLKVEDRDRLPVDPTDTLCERPDNCVDPKCYCAMSADVRVGENPALASMHTLFHRNHNRLAKALVAQNPTWTDDQLFYVARKINVAIEQHITYKEYLKATIGESVMDKYDITVQDSGYKDNYDTNTDATILNEFAGAAYRYGHSIVPRKLSLRDFDLNLKTAEDLNEHFFNPDLYHEFDGAGVDFLIMGLTASKCPLRDRIVEDAVRINLFKDKNNFTLDLAALNIQRGRDHGIPSYNKYREFCSLPRATGFTSGSGLPDHNQESAESLEDVYSSVDDIDLFTGVVSETSAPGSQLGPTGQCLLATQFKRLRDGDRFFYEHPGVQGFTEEQLAEIKKMRMSTVICQNTGATQIQENVFLQRDVYTNKMIDCQDVLSVMDFSKWKGVAIGAV